LDDDGAGDAHLLAEGIIYAADNGADVINMSLGAEVSFCPSYVQDAVDYAYGLGVVLVAAGGNTSSATDFFPANCDHVLGVAATELDGDVAGYSTVGNHINVAAPGSGIYSTFLDGSYGYKTGTSMAAPYVSGLASLIYARYPEYTPDQVVSAILDNADDMGAPGWDPSSGCGLINAFSSLAVGAAGPYPECLGMSAWGTSERVAEPNPHAAYIPGEVIVSYLPGTKVGRVSAQYGADSEYVPTLDIWRLRTQPGEELILLAELRSNPTVAHADLNYVITAR
jgi:subtilisin family serine protease